MDKGRHGRRDRLVKEKRHDTYRSREKLPEPTVCTDCGAVFNKGRWQWLPHPDAAHGEVCPACRRINDHYPAGTVQLSGAFFRAHREEILNLIHNVEKQEKNEHPMERIMDIERNGTDKTLVNTTGIHLARRLGDKLFQAYEGELDYHHEDGENLINVFWKR